MNLKAKEGLSVSDMIVVGFALFSMFFGAGNTVFPRTSAWNPVPAGLPVFSCSSSVTAVWL